MKNTFTFLLFLISFTKFQGQEIKNVPSGKITVVTNQIINFKNLRVEDNQIKFFNTETKSDFFYFFNTIKKIEDDSGNLIYLKKEDISKTKKVDLTNLEPEPKLEWIRQNDSLRENKQIRAEIIFKNGDTLRTHIKVSTRLFNSNTIDELSINKKITSISNGEKIKFRADVIKTVRFIDLNSKERFFEINGEELVELMYKGKICWFRRYYPDAYGNLSASNYFVNKELKQGISLGMISRRNNLLEITKTRPDLIPFVKNMEINDEQILILLKKFDK